jgi:hypothetical protein
MKYLLCLLFLVSAANVIAEKSLPPLVDFLDGNVSECNNPLKEITAFTVLLVGQSKTPEGQFLIQELEKIGSIKMFPITTSVDFSGFIPGMNLSLSVTDLIINGQEGAKIKRVSLRLSTSIEIMKTKHQAHCYIWGTNAFAENDNTMDALKKLMNTFVYYYKEANPNLKPIFYVYQ